MDKQDYFEKIAPLNENPEERIIKILNARGFLIDRTSAGYFLSDNFADQDIEYLSELLCKYDIGVVEKDFYEKNTISSNTILRVPRIIINPTANVERASDLFNDCSRKSMEVTTMRRSWSFLHDENMGERFLCLF